ncbi:hypothetical protein AMTR_s00062p00094870 [Amborella trichopoda]|uniref:Uncharacterized protein n=1 Tax=Amborella trichopoda TaxID=13333 RepID=U5DAP0_AMBTC|nr:hypothetical protein AMTR_s00062p00094870 [Amborella trichopoda]
MFVGKNRAPIAMNCKHAHYLGGKSCVETKAEAPVIDHQELINKYGGLFVEEKWPARPRGRASAAVKPPEQPKRNNGHLGKRGFFQPRGAWF